MTKRNKKHDFEDALWNVLVATPALIGFFYGLNNSHSIGIAGIWAFIGAIPGMTYLIIRRINIANRLKKSGIDEIDKMDGYQFEEYLALLFRQHGYKADVTRKSGDFGADLILQKDGVKIVVQAKRHKQNVGIKAVQEVYASMAHYKANEAWVVTNSEFTEAARKLARANNVKLINRIILIDMIIKQLPKAK